MANEINRLRKLAGLRESAENNKQEWQLSSGIKFLDKPDADGMYEYIVGLLLLQIFTKNNKVIKAEYAGGPFYGSVPDCKGLSLKETKKKLFMKAIESAKKTIEDSKAGLEQLENESE